MAETNSSIILPAPLFTDPRTLKALANGNFYVGAVDTDPTSPTNQIPVYNRNEDGSLVEVAQPISIGVGGYPVLNGIPFSPVVDRNYSIAVFDSIGVQRFYFPFIEVPQPLDSTLTALSELTGVANTFPYFDGDNSASLAALTNFAMTILSQPDAAGVLLELGLNDLGTAARRNVGNGTNQIPDMSFFASGSNYFKLPGGWIVQWGGGVSSSGQVISTYPVPFSVAGYVLIPYVVATTGVGGIPAVNVASLTQANINVVNSAGQGMTGLNVGYLAIGK